jgi:integrase
MRSLMTAAPWQDPESFIFWGPDPHRPISHKKIDDDFTRAVRTLGITDEERRARNLTLHSLRHFLNSLLVHAGVPVLRVQTLIGHTSLKMTENYLHANDDFKDMLAITAPLLQGGEKK